MSKWTHITSCLSVETGLTQPRSVLKKIITKSLKEAPKITGSEGCADVFVNVKSGYNFWTSADCNRCPFGETAEWSKDGGYSCEAPEGTECPNGKYQSCVIISVQGDLRDRVPEQTQKEFDEFLEYLKTRFYIRDYTVNIERD